ncbi:MAG TPA: cysteine peptidase family C39 domain-containing protein [Crinalium sp.]|jgi:predicted double-glycine peptidase
MTLGLIASLLFGALAFWWGVRFGRLLLRKGATANDLFKGKNSVSLAFLGLYVLLIVLALYVPQLQALPLEVRVYGMQVTWTILRIALLGMCGVAFIVSWQTARLQVILVVLIGLLGLGGFTKAESYFLAPIYASLEDNLRPNGVFQQTSSSSCAPAALATILHHWGLDATESKVAKLAGTSRLGTSMPQLIVAARGFGMDGMELSPTWEQMQQINRPGVLATWLYSQNSRAAHATALLGLTRDTATIADPAFGKIYRINRTQFHRIWRQQYVPIFHPTDTIIALPKAAEYLQQLGFLDRPASETSTNPDGQYVETANFSSLTDAIQRFQLAFGLKVTGDLTPETVLMLTGPFLEGVPTLDPNF